MIPKDDISEEEWNELTAEEKRRLEKDLCLRCGNPKREHTYFDTLCVECSDSYWDFKAKKEITISDNDSDCFLEYIRNNKEKVQFT